MDDYKLTPEELANLGMTEEEIAGLGENHVADDTDGEDEGTQDPGASGADGEGAGEDDGGDDGKGEGEGEGAKPKDNPPEDGKATGEDDKQDPPQAGGRDDGTIEDDKPSAPATVPLFKGEAPADLQAKLDDIQKREDELDEKFENGDLTMREYRAEVRKLSAERDALVWEARKAEISEAAIRQQLEKQWFSDVGDFLAAHPEIKVSQLRYEAFDKVVREVTGDEANANLSNRQQLEKAYERWVAELGIQPAAKSAPGKRAPEKDPASRQIPPNIGAMPSAEVTDTDDGRFAHLDRLAETDPLAYEEALSRMSDAERSAYLQSA